ncbi:hypothetical protein [Nonomuraea sp. KM90]|uniref:hypothetical protein n=1 Tax=Nonomuraea sp. KM90 TaxID=3457428 RepID=UPI003FCCC973
MSRSALVAWSGALGAAAYPTWAAWRDGPGYGWFSYCPASVLQPLGVWDRIMEPLLLPLRADAFAVVWLSLIAAVPVFVVLMASAWRRSGTTGRRSAAVLASLAVLLPLSLPYYDAEACAEVRVFSGRWFAKVVSHLGTGTSVALLGAALLVLLATRTTGPAEERPAGVAVRRVSAFLLCYWTVAVFLLVSGIMPMDFVSAGLLAWLSMVFGPWPLFGLVAVLALLVPVLRRLRVPR